jgi:hypothetical protein
MPVPPQGSKVKAMMSYQIEIYKAFRSAHAWISFSKSPKFWFALIYR